METAQTAQSTVALNKLWRQRMKENGLSWRRQRKEDNFKKFVEDYNNQQAAMKNFDGGSSALQAPVIDMFPEMDSSGQTIDQMLQPAAMKEKIIVYRTIKKSSINAKSILMYGGTGLLVGVLVGLIIKKL